MDKKLTKAQEILQQREKSKKINFSFEISKTRPIFEVFDFNDQKRPQSTRWSSGSKATWSFFEDVSGSRQEGQPFKTEVEAFIGSEIEFSRNFF